MKKLAMILLALGVVACSKSDDNPEMDALRQQWNLISEEIEQSGYFDPAEIPPILTEGLLASSSYFRCKGGEMSDNVQLWPGSGAIEVIFYEDGTCWDCWWDMAHQFDGGLFYDVYQWRYEDGVIVTWNDFGEYKAVVKAVNDEQIILDGNICSNIGTDGYGYRDPEIYLRIVMDREDEEARQYYIDVARNIEDFEQAE